MDIDVEVKSHDPKTLLDENGHYPEWMNQRAIKKHKQKFSKTKKVKKKVHKKKGEWWFRAVMMYRMIKTKLQLQGLKMF